MRMRIVRVISRMTVLLGLTGILAVNALAGGGPVPFPDGTVTTGQAASGK